jgi:hypothetical protein
LRQKAFVRPATAVSIDKAKTRSYLSNHPAGPPRRPIDESIQP